jgi:hypothetical protein
MGVPVTKAMAGVELVAYVWIAGALVEDVPDPPLLADADNSAHGAAFRREIELDVGM